MKLKVALLAAAFAVAAHAPALADITIFSSPGAVQPEENLLFTNNPPNGMSIEGVTNAGTFVTATGTETLVANGGQARIEALDGGFDSLLIDLSDAAQSFLSAEFRIFVGRGTATTASLFFYDTDGNEFSLLNTAITPNGFFSAQAINGQKIDYFRFTTNGTIQDVRQVRVGGVSSVVPEPATWAMMITGFGLAGAAIRTRRRTAAFA